jgi:ATP-dependent helicase/DNAse subunit B
MILLIGPPASGKTSLCVDRLRQALRDREPDSALLVPTTTLAEHLRNQLAREGFVFSPRAVSTFGKYVRDIVPDIRTADSATLEIVCEDLLERTQLAQYANVRNFPGFRSALVRTIEEFAGAAGTVAQLEAAGADPDFICLYDAVVSEIRNRGLVLRPERLRVAAERIRRGARRGTVLVAGFFAFTAPEIDILRALADRSNLTVSLPDSPGAGPAITALRGFASEIRTLASPATQPTRSLRVAVSLDIEAENIARRILERHAEGYSFREMGVIVRSEQPCVPALRTAFERFGIPARYYFAPALRSDPAVRYLCGLMEACLSGWGLERTLHALRMHGSPFESTTGDAFEYAVLEQLPDSGLDALRELAPDWSHWFLDELVKLTPWQGAESPAAVWCERLSQLTGLFRADVRLDSLTHDRVLQHRQRAIALEQFHSCLRQAALAIGENSIVTLHRFWSAVKIILGTATVRVVDRRRDVVHVIDAVEARQWRVRVAFVCGLLDGEFPRHLPEDPILPDGVRKRLQLEGVALRTTQDRQVEESFLFGLVLSRATEAAELSYARLNAKGEPNLPSFLLQKAGPLVATSAERVRPRPVRQRAPEPSPGIYTDELRSVLARKCAVLSASRIEQFLHCPFGLFASSTLKLAEPPCKPWDRLDLLAQGTIAHLAAEHHFRDGIAIQEAFEMAFAQVCADKRVPDGYRTEAVRLELQHNMELLARRNNLPAWLHSEFERTFEIPIADGLSLRGKIDRLEVDSAGRALIVDYKYQKPERLKETVARHEDGKAVQGGVYLVAAEALGYQPVGMVFAAFKETYDVRGWVQRPYAPELKNESTESEIRQRMISAREIAATVAQSIRDGRIAPEPEDGNCCWRCSYLKICRVDVAVAQRSAGGSQ